MSGIERYQVQIFPTETCNLGCDGCPYPGQSNQKKSELRQAEINPEDWKKITDYLYDQGSRLFCVMGGEPASYKGIGGVIKNITSYKKAFALLSTSGIHLSTDQKLRESVGEALSQPPDRKFKNGIAISFDMIPSERSKNSREYKAKQGLQMVEIMQKEYGDSITCLANVMVTPGNLPDILDIQTFLEGRGIYTNFCTKQGKCFGELNSVFNSSHFLDLKRVGAEMIRRKIGNKLVVNSVSYLSQLPGTIGMENYKCWKEDHGSPVLDVSPDGKVFRFCNWVGQNLSGGPPGVSVQALMNETVSWDEFWAQSKETTAMLCGGCSWSRRDRGVKPMVSFNPGILEGSNLPDFDPMDLRLQNIWVQAQLSV